VLTTAPSSSTYNPISTVSKRLKETVNTAHIERCTTWTNFPSIYKLPSIHNNESHPNLIHNQSLSIHQATVSTPWKRCAVLSAMKILVSFVPKKKEKKEKKKKKETLRCTACNNFNAVNKKQH
jgi:hypothetical protein